MDEVTQIRYVLTTLFEDGRLTGDNIRFHGVPLTPAEPDDGLTKFGGREVPELADVRTRHNKVRARFGDIPAPYESVPTYHVFDPEGVGDTRYFAALIDDPEALNSVTHSFDRQAKMRGILGARHWQSFINLYQGRNIVQPDGPRKPAAVVDDHAVWSQHSTVEDMLRLYEGQILMMEGILRSYGR